MTQSEIKHDKDGGAKMNGAGGVEIEVGQKWREMDKRFNRVVEIVGIYPNKFRSIAVRTVGTGRLSYCAAHRFNGKSGGYKLEVVATTDDLQKNELYVRGRWENISCYDFNGYVFIKFCGCVPITIIGGDIYPARFRLNQRPQAWAAAAEFTRQREQQIREVEEEIAQIKFRNNTDGASRFEHNVKVWERILAREQEFLDSLKKGWKE